MLKSNLESKELLYCREPCDQTGQITRKTLNAVRLLLLESWELQEHFRLTIQVCAVTFTVPKKLRFSDYTTVPRSQQITNTVRISQDWFSASKLGVVRPNVTLSVYKAQSVQTTSLSGEQHTSGTPPAQLSVPLHWTPANLPAHCLSQSQSQPRSSKCVWNILRHFSYSCLFWDCQKAVPLLSQQ